MKKYVFLLFIIVFFNFIVKAQTWTTLNSGTSNNLNTVSTPSQCVAYIVGDAGTILKTTDGGNTWVAQVSGTTQNLISVYFTSVNTGYAVGNNGAAVQTTDGGATWTAMNIDPTNTVDFRDIRFVNSQLGFASGGVPSGVIYRTQDGGATWTQVFVDNLDNYDIYSTFFTSASTGYASSGSGRIFETTDGGTSWNVIYTSSSLSSGVFDFTNPTNGIRPGYNGQISLTTNAGTTWSNPPSGTTDYLAGVDFYDNNNGYIVGGNLTTNMARILTTTDGGTTWNNIPAPLGTARLNRVKFYDNTIGYSVGQNGTILRRTNLSNLNVNNSTPTTICMGGSANLTASGANSYSWTPSASLNTATGASVIATPTVTTTYTIIGTTGCVTDTIFSTVIVSTPPSVNVNSAILCNQSCTSQTWNPQTSGSANVLENIDNVDDCVGYVIGDNGTILKTTDNGNSWTPQNSGTTTASLRGVKFVNADTGYVDGSGNTILKTINGGTTWTNIAPNLPGDSWNNLWVFDANTIIAVGGVAATLAPALIKSTDGGITWTSITTGALSTIYGIYFTDNLNGYITTNYGNILKTTDGGLTWTTALSNPQNNSSPQLSSIFFTDSNTGFAAGGRTPGNGVIYKTTDAGISWTPVYTNTSLYFSGIQFEDNLTGYASGGNIGANTGTLLKTSDGGVTWNAINTNSPRLAKTDIQNINDQFVVGLNGTILKLCTGDSVRLKASGTATSFLWSTGSTSQTITVKPSQTTTYSVTAIAAGCSLQPTAIATVSVPSFTVNSVTICSGQTVTLTAIGGTNYSWSNGQTTQSIAVSPVSGITNYTVSSTFDCCLKSAISTVTILSLPAVSVNSATICAGSTATLTASGANTYSWFPTIGLSNSSGNSVSASPTVTSTYSVIGTNSCGNDTAISTVTILNLPIITASSATVCAGVTATLTASGATTYTWSPTNGLSSITGSPVLATPLNTTTYSISGTDINGCANSATALVTIHQLPIISVNSATVCAGSTATLIATGANSYTWTPAIGLSANIGVTITVTPTITSTYNIAGTDINGCISSTNSTVSIPHPSNIVVNSDTLCAGDSTVLIANGANSYLWLPTASLSSTTGQTVTAFPLTTTTYSVIGTDGCGSNTAISTVLVYPSPSAVLISNNIGCQSLSAAIKGTKGRAPYTFTYQINGVKQTSVNSGADTSDIANLSSNNFPLGTYTYSIIGVSDANNCFSSIYNEFNTINVYPNPNALFSVDPLKTTALKSAITIKNESIGGIGWMWDFGDSSKSFSQNPVSHTYADTGTFRIRLVTTTQYGCKDSTYQTIVITQPFVLYIPNTFTPNGDTFNDVFAPKGEGVLKYEMYIYSRWGEEVFYTNDLNVG
jgi:photosystem II stability/assembly factor-like uncharacterized protein